MKLHHIVTPLVLAALAGCSTTQLPERAALVPAATAPRVASAAVPAPTATPDTAAPGATRDTSLQRSLASAPPSLDDPKSPLAGRSVYFEFDSAVLQASDGPLVEAHGKYLAESRAAQLRIEGHTDERGGREYNLALGQRRAEATKKALVLLGAATARLEATSFGEEKPRASAHDEAAWVKNRRADLNYIAR
jgi:peptidoglycan-associated lipoprotein